MAHQDLQDIVNLCKYIHRNRVVLPEACILIKTRTTDIFNHKYTKTQKVNLFISKEFILDIKKTI